MRDFLNRLLSRSRSDLLAGLLVIAPLAITLWVIVSLVGFADGFINLLPQWAQPETYLGFPVPGLGLLLTMVVVGLVGFTMRYYTGRRIVEFYEGILARLPIASGIYQGLKQLVETLFSQKGRQFRQVVLVEYPRRGLWCLAFMTNEEDFLVVEEGPEGGTVGIFLPSTPNPTTGFYLIVPREDVRLIDMSIEEAFKLIMSAGVITPARLRDANLLDSNLLDSNLLDPDADDDAADPPQQLTSASRIQPGKRPRVASDT